MPGRLLLVFIIALGITGCGADRKAVEELMSKRAQALNSRDVKLYQSLISRNYQDKGKDFAGKSAEITSTFASFEQIAYRSLDRRITISNSDAKVTGSYTMKVTVKGRPLELGGTEIIRLTKESDGWKITGGI